jgi:hypothetical protein
MPRRSPTANDLTTRRKQHSRRNEPSPCDPGYENRLQEACAWLREQQTSVPRLPFSEACKKFRVKYHTLRNRFHGRSQCVTVAHDKERITPLSALPILLEYIGMKGDEGEPYSDMSLRLLVKKVGLLVLFVTTAPLTSAPSCSASSHLNPGQRNFVVKHASRLNSVEHQG